MCNEIDPDQMYEDYREQEGERLEEAIKGVFTQFVVLGKPPLNYYKDQAERFKRHLITILNKVESEKETKMPQKDTILKVAKPQLTQKEKNFIIMVFEQMDEPESNSILKKIKEMK